MVYALVTSSFECPFTVMNTYAKTSIPTYLKAQWVAVVALLLVATWGTVDAGVPENNLSYPLLVQTKSGATGSGFFLESERSIYLITARHVVAKEKETDVLTIFAPAPDHDPANQLKLSLNLGLLAASNHISVHPERDVVAVEIGTMNGNGDLAPMTYHKGITTLKKGTLTVVASANTISFKEIGITRQVYVMGYPTSVGIESARQLDHRTPLIRSGIVAGKNKLDRSVILDCQVDGGNSGGPVIQVSQTESGQSIYRLIGLVIEFVPSAEEWVSRQRGQVSVNISNSGYAVIEPMDTIWEMLNPNEVQLTQGSAGYRSTR